ncbi:transmembrane protein 116 [Mantella aurantiaca]
MDYTIEAEYALWINSTLTGHIHGVYFTIKWIQVITATLSILGPGSIIGYAVFQNVVTSPEVRPIFYLSLSDLLLAACWLIGAVLYRGSCQHNIACYSLQIMGQMFYISTFFYTLNFTWQTFCSLRRRLDSELYKMSDNECRFVRITTVLSSIVPLLFILPVLCIGNTNNCYEYNNHSCLVLNVGSQITADLSSDTQGACTRLHLYSIAVYLVTFCLAVIPILGIAAWSHTVVQRHLVTTGFIQDQQLAVIKVMSWSLLLFPAIFFICCLPDVILALLKLADCKVANALYICLYAIQAITAVSPGFLNCLAYGWTQHMLRTLKQRGCRDVDTQTPLLRSQKKLYASIHSSTADIRPNIVSAL